MCLRRLNDGQIFGRIRYSPWRGVVIGVGLALFVGVAIYPFRHYDYELEFLLVLPVVLCGCSAGGTAALVTAVVSVVDVSHRHPHGFREGCRRTSSPSSTFLGSALAVGAAVGAVSDRLTLAKSARGTSAGCRSSTPRSPSMRPGWPFWSRSTSSAWPCCGRFTRSSHAAGNDPRGGDRSSRQRPAR